MSNILEKIVVIGFPPDQYYREITKKNQIVLHHTISGREHKGDINWWLSDSKKIATHIIIDWKGIPYQCYSSRYFAHHLGIKQKFLRDQGFIDWQTRNLKLNQHSIAIEIDSWGGLAKNNNKWYPAKWSKWSNTFVARTDVKSIPVSRIQFYDELYRGFNAYEKYTDNQIETIKELLSYWGKKYNISLRYHEDMWDLSDKALSGVSGVWTHNSYRSDKSDPHPQNELVKMLKDLK